ncbi:metal-dependent phosphohydrolase [Desulfosporosinus sp. I2]|nr:metal-dependent phosphohydrolase [Desulfosporosinus sp. I2]
MKILHDNLKGSTQEKVNLLESRQEHCIIGEHNLRDFPFLTNPKNIIRYHHEKCDGSGFFGLSNDEIPLMAQIIAFSDTLDLAFDLRNTINKELIIMFVYEHKTTFFSSALSEVFFKISEQDEFWEALSDENIDDNLKKVIPNYSNELDYSEIHTITKTLSKIIDAKSQYTQTHSLGLSEKLERMSEFYGMDPIMTLKLLIATDLHDLGKLAISNYLLDKPGELSKDEYEEIKKHAKITKLCLQNIKGFKEITEWASNHHEKLDGSGYPQGLKAKDLDFNSRLIACLDIYQALREERPYRKSMDHIKAMGILKSMTECGQLDTDIVGDINNVFSKDVSSKASR